MTGPELSLAKSEVPRYNPLSRRARVDSELTKLILSVQQHDTIANLERVVEPFKRVIRPDPKPISTLKSNLEQREVCLPRLQHILKIK
jgi:hypothetical protein